MSSTAQNKSDLLTPEAADLMLNEIASRARAAFPDLSHAKPEVKTEALIAAAAEIRAQSDRILDANTKDMKEAARNNLAPSMLDRLELDDVRLDGIAKGLEAVAELPDPVGRVLADWTRPNGLIIQKFPSHLG
jgi:glutamate-5-semialdehyde dehydrogenase